MLTKFDVIISMRRLEMTDIRAKAEKALGEFIGGGKSFRPGQYEAIEATLTNRRTLVVQRTGWGKSMVYFVCTKLQRDEGKGVTLIVSPLLTLMKNQIESAEKAGLSCDVLNSTKNDDQKSEIIKRMKDGEIDIVLTTPETLFTDLVQKALPQINIGLFVIDEAHCISDWGHDFRLDYCRLNRVIRAMPQSVPILATTATANDRVIADLKDQMGGDVFVSRGPLMRDNLSIQVLKLNGKTERYAWMCETIPRINGSGIVYCLTRDDCDEISEFLNQNGIPARAYYSGKKDAKNEDIDPNEETERLFMNNEIKAIVATVKLGMGYDKPDIAFVIHYQTPSNIVAYYQQIGRAGRAIPRAYTFLMNGEEDEEILRYFRETAFPSEKESSSVYNYIKKKGGASLYDIISEINFSKTRIDNALKFLVNEGFIYKDGRKYFLSATAYRYNREHYEAITKLREIEYEQMRELLDTDKCFSRFVVNALDDPTENNCGRCANCLGYEEFPAAVSESAIEAAAEFLEERYYPIEPRKQWANTSLTGSTRIRKPNEIGICLSRYGHPVYGELVKHGKYAGNGFCDRLVDKSAEVLSPFIAEHSITALTYVPSLRSNIVPEFAQKLANKLGIPCLCLLEKTSAKQQKEMENSSFQCENAQKSFSLLENASVPERVLLVDDMVDSRWTLTVCGNILTNAGAEQVYPFALAATSKKDD